MRKSFKQLMALLLVFMSVLSVFPSTYAADVVDDEQSLVTDSPSGYHVAPVDVQPDADVTVVQDYIRSHMKSEYVGVGDELIPYDIISIKQTIADKSAMLENGQDLTISGLWADSNNDGYSDYPDSYLTQLSGAVILYQISEDAEYVVGHVNKLNSDSAEVVDWLFAENTLAGNVLDDCIYDADTGLVYVPTYYTYVDGDMVVANQTQIQLLYALSGNLMDATTQVNVKVDNIRVQGSVPSMGVVETSCLDTELAIQLACDDDARASLSVDSIAAVYVDDVPFTSDEYFYDASTGVLYLSVCPAIIDTIHIELRNPTGLETAANSILGLFVLKASAVEPGETAKDEMPDDYETPAKKTYNYVYGNTIYDVSSMEHVWMVDKKPVVGQSVTVFADAAGVSAAISNKWPNHVIPPDYDVPVQTAYVPAQKGVDYRTPGIYLSMHNTDSANSITSTARYIITNQAYRYMNGTLSKATDKDILHGLTSTHGAQQWYWDVVIPAGKYVIDGVTYDMPKMEFTLHCAHASVPAGFNDFDYGKDLANYGVAVPATGLRILEVVTYRDGRSGRMLVGLLVPTTKTQCGIGLGVIEWRMNDASITVTKSIADGSSTNASGADWGWHFGLYASDGATLLADGWTANSTSNPSVTFEDLSPGTYYVKELPDSLNYCYDGNGQLVANATKKSQIALDTTVHKVVISDSDAAAGVDKAVKVTNTRKYAQLVVTKKTYDGVGVEWGWHFGLYSDANCTNQLSEGWTANSDTNPSVTFTNLSPGTYYVKELPDSLNYCYDSSGQLVADTAKKSHIALNTTVQTVVISDADAINHTTRSVSILNIARYGTGNFKKVMANGSNADLSGWEFTVYRDAACTSVVATGVTDADGIVRVYDVDFDYVKLLELVPGTYYIKETNHVDYSKYAADGSVVPTGLWGSEYIYNDPSVTGGNAAKITIEANKTTDKTIINTFGGLISVQKKTNTNRDLDGWKFRIYTDEACTVQAKNIYGNTVSDIVTDLSGAGVSELLNPGRYYVKEIGGVHVSDFWLLDSHVESVDVEAKKTALAGPFENDAYGRVSVKKQTNTGANLDGWVFKIYHEDGTEAKCRDNSMALITTDSNGVGLSGYLSPGKYYVKEISGQHDDDYWVKSLEEKSFEVVGGSDVPLDSDPFENVEYGRVTVKKWTNTGEDLDGWVFKIYHEDGSEAVYRDGSAATMTTDTNGDAISGYLLPGKYYVEEISGLHDNEYWVKSTDSKSVEVIAGTDTPVEAFQNIEYGRVVVNKWTNTGKDLDGWEFKIYHEDGTEATYRDGSIAVVTTDTDGDALSGYLLPGKYYAKEIGGQHADEYWSLDTGIELFEVVGGEDTSVDDFKNYQYGRVSIKKITNTGKDLDGWVFKIYHENGTEAVYRDGSVATMTTDANGYAISEYLLPGKYYVKEISGLHDDEYWLMSSEQKSFEITGGADNSLGDNPFKNYEYGRIDLQKEMATGGPLAGWNFIVYTDAACTQVAQGLSDLNNPDSVVDAYMRTDDNGYAMSCYLPVIDNIGTCTYWVKEIIDEENGLYYCKTQNPVEVVVVSGSMVRAQSGVKENVSFINALRSVTIDISKTDSDGTPLSDVTFMLEWYDSDANMWRPVQYSDSIDVVLGQCGTSGLNTAGELTTGDDGVVVFENLYPLVDYRVTETQTVNGMVLLKDAILVKQGDVSIDTRRYSIEVVNDWGWTPTPTGGSGLLFNMCVGLCSFIMLTTVGLYTMHLLNRKRKRIRF